MTKNTTLEELINDVLSDNITVDKGVALWRLVPITEAINKWVEDLLPEKMHEGAELSHTQINQRIGYNQAIDDIRNKLTQSKGGNRASSRQVKCSH